MSKKLRTIEIDNNYYMEVFTDYISLKYKTDHSSNYWYLGNIPSALKKYLSESLSDSDDIKQILKRIDEVEKLIDSKF